MIKGIKCLKCKTISEVGFFWCICGALLIGESIEFRRHDTIIGPESKPYEFLLSRSFIENKIGPHIPEKDVGIYNFGQISIIKNSATSSSAIVSSEKTPKLYI